MVKIKFRGEKINELEAKTLISDLKKGKVEATLNAEERKHYNSVMKLNPEIFHVPKDEAHYLADEIEKDMNIAKYIKKLEYCRKHGHSEKEGSGISAFGSHTGARVYATCSRCGMQYQRKMSSDEWGEFDRMMRTPLM